jgi:hypothetical protein
VQAYFCGHEHVFQVLLAAISVNFPAFQLFQLFSAFQ